MITYEVIGPEQLQVSTDWAGVVGAPEAPVVEVCDGLEPGPFPVPTGCTPA